MPVKSVWYFLSKIILIFVLISVTCTSSRILDNKLVKSAAVWVEKGQKARFLHPLSPTILLFFLTKENEKQGWGEEKGGKEKKKAALLVFIYFSLETFSI